MQPPFISIYILLTFIFINMSALSQSSDTLPYREIPDYSENFTAGGISSRLMDGLGFRFYWATEGLRIQDLNYRPTQESRSVEETIDHILSMVEMIAISVCKIKIEKDGELTFEAKRTKILHHIKSVSDVLLMSSSEDFKNYTIDLRNGDTLPFWFFVNGQISDCIWHCGQISSFRRITGNPLNSNVSMFKGTDNN